MISLPQFVQPEQASSRIYEVSERILILVEGALVPRVARQSGTGVPHSRTSRNLRGAIHIRDSVLECGNSGAAFICR